MKRRVAVVLRKGAYGLCKAAGHLVLAAERLDPTYVYAGGDSLEVTMRATAKYTFKEDHPEQIYVPGGPE